MIILKAQICVLLFILCTHQSLSFSGGVKQFAEDVFEIINTAKKVGNYDETKALVIDSPIDIEDKEIIGIFKTIKLYGEIEFYHALHIVDRLAEQVEIPQLKEQLKDDITNIDIQFKKLLHNFEQPETIIAWYNFSTNALLTIRYNIRDLRNVLNGQSGTKDLSIGVLELLQVEAVRQNATCGRSVFTIRQLLVDIVRSVIIIEIKALAVLTFVIPILSRDGKYDERISDDKADFERRLMDYIRKSIETMKLAPGQLIACDPPYGSWVRDESYIEMDKHAQQVIVAYSFTWSLIYGSAKSLCKRVGEDFNDGKHNGLTFYDGTFCHGKLSDCRPIGKISGGCLSNPDDSAKRYEWIETDDEGSYGQNIGSCPNGKLIQHDPEYKTGNRHCDCHCLGDLSRVSVELISSDVENNMVITGLRFIKKWNVLYLQPKQGKLLENGRIDPELQSWVELPKDGETGGLTLEDNIFFLDDFMVPFGSAVTAITFQKVLIGLILGYKIQIFGTQFDFSTGKLSGEAKPIAKPESYYYTRRIEVSHGQWNSIHNPHLTHDPHSESNGAVTLDRSDLNQDYGQSTVPLFHGVALETDPPSPLGGVGIFHKRANNSTYAGFISLRLHPLYYEKYLKDFKDHHKINLLM